MCIEKQYCYGTCNENLITLQKNFNQYFNNFVIIETINWILTIFALLIASVLLIIRCKESNRVILPEEHYMKLPGHKTY